MNFILRIKGDGIVPTESQRKFSNLPEYNEVLLGGAHSEILGNPERIEILKEIIRNRGTQKEAPKNPERKELLERVHGNLVNGVAGPYETVGHQRGIQKGNYTK